MVDVLVAEAPRSPTPVEIVQLPPDADYAAVPSIRHLLTPVFTARWRTVVADRSAVSFMDCAALGILLTANADLGGRMVLVDCPENVLALLHLTGTYDLFRLVPQDRDDS